MLRLRRPGEARVDAAPFEEAYAGLGLSRVYGAWQGDRCGLRRRADGLFGEAVVTSVYLGTEPRRGGADDERVGAELGLRAAPR